MLRIIFLLSSIFFIVDCFSQNKETDSLLALLANRHTDTDRVNILNKVAANYVNTSPENAIKYGLQAKNIAESASYTRGLAYALKNIGIGYYMQSDYKQTLTYWSSSLKEFEEAGDTTGIANILSNLGAVYFNQGDDARALDSYLKSLNYAEELKDTLRIATALNNIGALYFNKSSDHDKALNYYLKALPLCELLKDDDAIGTITVNIGEIYLERGKDTLALQYFERSLKAYENSNNIISYPLNNIGKVYEQRKDYSTALKYHQRAFDVAKKAASKMEMTQSLQGIARIYMIMKNAPKALESYNQAEELAQKISANYELKNIYKGLSDVYAGIHDYPSAYKYQVLLNTIKDTLYNSETEKKIAFLQLNFDIQKKQTEIDLLTRDKTVQDLNLKRQKTVRNSLIAVLSLVIVIVFILFRNYRIKDRVNALLGRQKKALEDTLQELKITQTQLIQSEKMASLGELTAGIAHEIQNPLNFVNNFCEVNNELIEELKSLALKTSDPGEEELLNDIFQNNEKIAFHGRRADAIVKGMLQHSRKNTGIKEPTDINALCDEYLRLSYHGLRAKNKNFNSDFKTDFDPSIGKINIVAQDVGRALLNLFNNAFYAISDKKKTAGENYKPIVSVSTRLIPSAPGASKGIEIRVRDNGNGIPRNIIDKIFQPFFTTKPTGEGTGLGLSLAYDIIKAHGGDIKVETHENEGTVFTITIPMS
jgi:two-component system NtrC family sensor kinase